MTPDEMNRRASFTRGQQDAFSKSVYRKFRTLLCSSAAALALSCSIGHAEDRGKDAAHLQTRTPIKHVVVIMQENRTFDHYFGTYPKAANIRGESSWVGVTAPEFHARGDTPKANNYLTNPDLLDHNSNVSLTGAQANPVRTRPADAFISCTNFRQYTVQQQQADDGRMDKFIIAPPDNKNGCEPDASQVMMYFDGNTVTALWNYAQHYSISDAFFNTTMGGTLTSHLNMISGNTSGLVLRGTTSSSQIYTNPIDGTNTLIGELSNYLDDCDTVSPGVSIEMTGKNVGDLLNAKNISWGYFHTGFKPTQSAVLNPDGSTQTKAVCGQKHTEHQWTTDDGATYVVPNPTTNFTGDIHGSIDDYVGYTQPFQAYASTRNPHHLPPSSVAEIGLADQANHQYDTSDFVAALKAGNFPAVSFLKGGWWDWGHPSISDPLVEQAWLVTIINEIMKQPDWKNTAILITWDDYGGWYDHAKPPVLDASNTPDDYHCGNGQPAPGDMYARCRLGIREPFLLISPWAKKNYIDHAYTEDASILRFIEDNWNLGRIEGATPLPAGKESFDRYAGSLEGMFDFDHEPNAHPLILDPIRGTVVHDNNGQDGQGQNDQGANAGNDNQGG